MKVRIKVTIVKEFDIESEGDPGYGLNCPARTPAQVIDDEIHSLQQPGSDVSVLRGRLTGHARVIGIKDSRGNLIETVSIERVP